MGQPTSKPRYYHILGVEQNASSDELKKAYRKNAVRLHPDKPGGDAERFKEMKYAYDVLSDPVKRIMYNNLGELGVKVLVEHQAPTPDMFNSLSLWGRTLIVLTFTLILGYLLLFPILLSIRWDHPNSMKFAHVFIPVWIGLSVVLIICLCSIGRLPSMDPEDDSEEHQKQVKEAQQKGCQARVCSTVVISIIFLLLLFLVLRLDGETNWSYFWVIWPWILLEVGLCALGIWNWFRGPHFEGMGEDGYPNIDGGMEWFLFQAAQTCPHLFHIMFAMLLAMKMDGAKMSWWEVFGPIWVQIGLCICLDLSRCAFVGGTKDDEVSEDAKNAKKRLIAAEITRRIVWLGCTLLFCYKLVHPKAFLAFIIFLPIFVVAGCLCCVLTCMVCCNGIMGDIPSDEEIGRTHATANAPSYGTVRPPPSWPS